MLWQLSTKVWFKRAFYKSRYPSSSFPNGLAYSKDLILQQRISKKSCVETTGICLWYFINDVFFSSLLLNSLNSSAISFGEMNSCANRVWIMLKQEICPRPSPRTHQT